MNQQGSMESPPRDQLQTEHTPQQHRRSSTAGRLSGRAAVLLGQGADRREAIADQVCSVCTNIFSYLRLIASEIEPGEHQASKMAQQLQETLAKNHVQHQHLRSAEFSMKSDLENAKQELATTKVNAALRVPYPCCA